MSAKTISQKIATTVSQLQFEDIPASVVEKGKALIMDTLIVAAAGRAEDSSHNFRQVISSATSGKCRVWFDDSEQRFSATDATFLNTLHAGALDYDSLNGAVHTDLVTLPAAWAVAEHTDASPTELFTAWIAAAEIVSRISRSASGTSKGWSGTSIYGGIGAAIASGLLLKLDESQLAHAIGLAVVQAAGTQQANIEQTLAKRLQPALAARDGVFAALLAQAGATAPSQALEGKFGLRALYQPGNDEDILRGWGVNWQLSDTAIKIYPVCACSHAAIEAILKLRPQITADLSAVNEIVADISPFMHRLVGGEFILQGNLDVIAQFNLRYHLATALLNGPLTLEHIKPEALLDASVQSLVGLIRLHIDHDNHNELAPAGVTVVFKDGRQLHESCENIPGSPQLPLSKTQLRSKVEACAAQARPVIDESRLEKITNAINNLTVLNRLEEVWGLE
ncbi:MmgE/PrpD family protein [Pantoea endophytica]